MVENIMQFLLEIFILFSAVKEFWKSIKIWESYCQKDGGFFFGTVYIPHVPCFCLDRGWCYTDLLCT